MRVSNLIAFKAIIGPTYKIHPGERPQSPRFVDVFTYSIESYFFYISLVGDYHACRYVLYISAGKTLPPSRLCPAAWSCPERNFATFAAPLGTIAQVVEQWIENPCVPGSNPGGTTPTTSGLRSACCILSPSWSPRASHHTFTLTLFSAI